MRGCSEAARPLTAPAYVIYFTLQSYDLGQLANDFAFAAFAAYPSSVFPASGPSIPTGPALNTPTRRLRPRLPARACTRSNRTSTRTYPRTVFRIQQVLKCIL